MGSRKEYQDDVKQIRYIIGLATEESRAELTRQTLMAQTEEQQEHFVNTLKRSTPSGNPFDRSSMEI